MDGFPIETCRRCLKPMEFKGSNYCECCHLCMRCKKPIKEKYITISNYCIECDCDMALRTGATEEEILNLKKIWDDAEEGHG